MLKSALLLFKKLVKDLKAYGQMLKPYDPCIVNIRINCALMAVTWHVDNLKVSDKMLLKLLT